MLAARWCGAFHAAAEELLAAEPELPLTRYDVDYYVGWARRTLEFADELPGSSPWLEQLCRRYPEAVERLLDSPATVIHGEFYPHNIVVTEDDQIYPVDWESAAIAPGVFDIATLAEGWPDEDAAACFDEYCAARWPAAGRRLLRRCSTRRACTRLCAGWGIDGSGRDRRRTICRGCRRSRRSWG